MCVKSANRLQNKTRQHLLSKLRFILLLSSAKKEKKICSFYHFCVTFAQRKLCRLNAQFISFLLIAEFVQVSCIIISIVLRLYINRHSTAAKEIVKLPNAVTFKFIIDACIVDRKLCWLSSHLLYCII